MIRKYKFAEVGQAAVEEAFLKFHDIMTAASEPYFLIGGTLLGLVREGHLLYHDRDIDIGIPDEATLRRVAERLRESGYFDEVSRVTGVRNGKIVWVRKFVGDDRQICFELQAHYKQGDTTYYNRPMGPSWPWREGRCEWPSKFFRSLGFVKAYDRAWPTPSPVEDFLTMFYGDDWKNEKQYHDWRYNTKNLKQGYLGAAPVIMIAGASRGIGAALLQSLSARGCKVSACSRTIQESDGDVFKVRCDLTDEKQVRQWVAKTQDKFGDIDVMIYNAGLMYFDNLYEASTKDLDEMYALTMRGYHHVLKAILPIMDTQGDGYIINIGSTRSMTAAPGKGLYSAVKHGARAMTDAINMEYVGKGVYATSANFGVVYAESTIKKYGEKMREFKVPLVGMDDVIKTINYLLSLSCGSRPKSITVGGML